MRQDNISRSLSLTCGDFVRGGSEVQRKFWCGLFNPGWQFDQLAMITQFIRKNKGGLSLYRGITYEFMSATVTREVKIDESLGEMLLPVAATERGQKLAMTDKEHDASFVPGKYEWLFYRVGGGFCLSSGEDFVVGPPLVLGHSPRRQKLRLLLFPASLNWSKLEVGQFLPTAHLGRFLRGGFSLQRLSPGEFAAVAEPFAAQGYCCFNLADDFSALSRPTEFNGLLLNSAVPRTSALYERAVSHIAAFDEADLFICARTDDTPTAKTNLATQTKLPWQERSVAADNADRAAFEADFWLGALFEYIQKRYRPDEYTVYLCART